MGEEKEELAYDEESKDWEPETRSARKQLWRLLDHGETFTIMANSAEKAKTWYKRHLKDIRVPVSDADIDSITAIPADEEIKVHYLYNDVEVSLRAEQWVAICDGMDMEWNILSSSAWTV